MQQLKAYDKVPTIYVFNLFEEHKNIYAFSIIIMLKEGTEVEIIPSVRQMPVYITMTSYWAWWHLKSPASW